VGTLILTTVLSRVLETPVQVVLTSPVLHTTTSRRQLEMMTAMSDSLPVSSCSPFVVFVDKGGERVD
jgi:hypothetical protein